MVEQFRQPFADRFAMLVFNKQILKSEDFTRASNGSMLLKETSRRKVLTEWEKFLNLPQRLDSQSDEITPKELLSCKVGELRQWFTGGPVYRNLRLIG
jgi:CRISPR/Cas system-associated endonuclease Cas1